MQILFFLFSYCNKTFEYQKTQRKKCFRFQKLFSQSKWMQWGYRMTYAETSGKIFIISDSIYLETKRHDFFGGFYPYWHSTANHRWPSVDHRWRHFCTIYSGLQPERFFWKFMKVYPSTKISVKALCKPKGFLAQWDFFTKFHFFPKNEVFVVSSWSKSGLRVL